jgi:hypothetical protein
MIYQGFYRKLMIEKHEPLMWSGSVKSSFVLSILDNGVVNSISISVTCWGFSGKSYFLQEYIITMFYFESFIQPQT